MLSTLYLTNHLYYYIITLALDKHGHGFGSLYNATTHKHTTMSQWKQNICPYILTCYSMAIFFITDKQYILLNIIN